MLCVNIKWGKWKIYMWLEWEDSICILSFFLWKCNCVLTWMLHREVAFIQKVISAVAWPSTHTSLQGASPQPSSELPAPLSIHLVYKQAGAHTHSLRTIITVREGYAEKTGCSQVVLAFLQLAWCPCRITQFWLFREQESDQRESEGLGGNCGATCYDVKAPIYCICTIINSWCFVTAELLSFLQPLQ